MQKYISQSVYADNLKECIYGFLEDTKKLTQTRKSPRQVSSCGGGKTVYISKTEIYIFYCIVCKKGKLPCPSVRK